MNWTSRLNRCATLLPLGSGHVELLQWEHDPHVEGNVPHRHTFFEVCLVGAWGEGIYAVEGSEHRIGPGSVLFARPGVVHQIRSTAQPHMELYWVCWGRKTSDSHCPPHGPAPPPRGEKEVDRLLDGFAASGIAVARDEGGRVLALWRALRALAEGPVPAAAELQLASVMSCLILALAQAGSEGGSEGGSPRACETEDDSQLAGRLGRIAVRYIHDNLYRPLPVSEVARHVHVSPRHLSRLMLSFTGVSPSAYIEQARIDRACALLQHRQLSIREVAAEVGYADVHYFTRVFTRCCGCSPGRYRTDPSRRVRGVRQQILS